MEVGLGYSLTSEAVDAPKSFAISRPSSAMVSVALRRGCVSCFGCFYRCNISVAHRAAGEHMVLCPDEDVISFSVGSEHVSLCMSLTLDLSAYLAIFGTILS